MSLDLPISKLEERFEEEFTKLIPNQEEASPQEIQRAAHSVARKLNIEGEITITCERPPGGRLKCKLNLKLKIEF